MMSQHIFDMIVFPGAFFGLGTTDLYNKLNLGKMECGDGLIKRLVKLGLPSYIVV